MNSLRYSQILFVLIVGLTVTEPIPVSEFCGDYAKAEVRVGQYFQGFRFIQLKDMNYIFINSTKLAKPYVYELDLSCTDRTQCPKIGDRQEFAKVFPQHKGELTMAFLQEGITYLFSGGKVTSYENKVKKQEFNEKDFWQMDGIEYLVLYLWEGNTRRAILKFMPVSTHSRKESKTQWGLQMDSCIDRYGEYYSVELWGNYESVHIVGDVYITFGDYFITETMKSYLYLPNGDAIVAKSGKPYYVRQNGMDFLKLFGCEGPLLERELTDTPLKDNPYPYFVKN